MIRKLFLVSAISVNVMAAQSISKVTWNDAAHWRYNDGCVGTNCANGPQNSMNITHAIGGDSYACAWADDGNLYCGVDDNYGADYAYAAGGNNTSIIKITGSPTDNTWALTNINQMTSFGGETACCTNGWADGGQASWKITFGGMASYSGTLYAMMTREIYEISSSNATGDTLAPWLQDSKYASIIKSSDHGVTWTNPFGTTSTNGAAPTSPNSMFGVSYTFGCPSFVDFGFQDGACPSNNPDNCNTYVYATSTDGSVYNGQYLYTGRVRKDHIANLTASDWSFYTGGDGSLDANWSTSLSSAVPAYTKQWSLSMNKLTYIPSVGKYFLINNNFPDMTLGNAPVTSSTTWVYTECDHPWGPCGSYLPPVYNVPGGYYSTSIIPKWSNTATGQYVILYSGDYGTSTASPNTTKYTLYADYLTLTPSVTTITGNGSIFGNGRIHN